MKATRSTRLHFVLFHLYEISRTGKPERQKAVWLVAYDQRKDGKQD